MTGPDQTPTKRNRRSTVAIERRRIKTLRRRLDHLRYRIDNYEGRSSSHDKAEAIALEWALDIVLDALECRKGKGG